MGKQYAEVADIDIHFFHDCISDQVSLEFQQELIKVAVQFYLQATFPDAHVHFMGIVNQPCSPPGFSKPAQFNAVSVIDSVDSRLLFFSVT